MTALTRPSRFAGATDWRSVTEPITEIVTPNPVTRYDAAIIAPEVSRDPSASGTITGAAQPSAVPATNVGPNPNRRTTRGATTAPASPPTLPTLMHRPSIPALSPSWVSAYRATRVSPNWTKKL